MIRQRDLRGSTPHNCELLSLLPRPQIEVEHAVHTAQKLIDDVRAHGSQALREHAAQFDGVTPSTIRVDPATIRAAVKALSSVVRDSLEQAIDRVTEATRAQVPGETTTEIASGAHIVQRWHPVSRAGLYVPGGKAVYPSSVVMNAVPAQVAGVRSIALASPSQREYGGSVHPTILAAAGLLGIDEVYAMGGASAIGALAWGVPDIGLEPVDIITGPGNVYVAAAKRLVRGQAGIDSEAGPTEILIIADEHADSRLVAADLVSQAEHDESAAAVLVTTSETVAEAVTVELVTQVEHTAHSERVRAALSGQQSAIVLVDTLEIAADFSNAYGPEHLEIHTQNPDEVLTKIRNAGAIFMGQFSPVSLGDYLAGSNHILPTGGQARFSAGLGAYSFLRPQQVIRYNRDALREVSEPIVALSQAEDLPAHGDAIKARFTTS